MPPCMTDPEGLCAYTRAHPVEWLRRPFQLTTEEGRALEVYKTARALSGFDARGLPTLTNLDSVLREFTFGLEPGESRALVQSLAIIHNLVLTNELARLAEGNSGSE